MLKLLRRCSRRVSGGGQRFECKWPDGGLFYLQHCLLHPVSLLGTVHVSVFLHRSTRKPKYEALRPHASMRFLFRDFWNHGFLTRPSVVYPFAYTCSISFECGNPSVVYPFAYTSLHIRITCTRVTYAFSDECACGWVGHRVSDHVSMKLELTRLRL